jgi:alkane 1-monooxygenase
MSVLPYFLAYLYPLIAMAGMLAGDIWTFSGVFFLFILTPIMDEISGSKEGNPTSEEEEQNKRNWFFDILLWIWVPLQLGFMTWGFGKIAFDQLTTLEFIGVSLSTGIITGGIGINIAHELMHRQGSFDRALAEILMSLVSYNHFCIEHVYGHHKNVATPNDPATSRFGESLYTFLPRTMFGTLKSAWILERDRCGRANIGRWSLKNRRFRYSLITLALYSSIPALMGPWALLYFVIQSAVAFTLLEVINYVEHYGLQRKEISKGRYERVLPKHSWNSTHRLTSYYLFNLPRHADHHYLASRHYYNLRHMEDSPQLPAGYATMLTIAIFPPLWHKIMDPRVIAWNNKKDLVEAPKDLVSAT